MSRYVVIAVLASALWLAGCARPSAEEEGIPLTEQHRIAVRARNLQKAHRLERQILARGGKELATYQSLRKSYAFAGQFEEARRVMRKALNALPELDPVRRAQVHRLIAADSYAQGDHATALTQFERALQLAPEDPEVTNDFAYFLVDTEKDIRRGLQLARKAVTARPERPEARDTMGWALCKAGDYRGAIEHLDHALRLDPDNSEVLYHLGVALEGAGDVKGAVQRLTQCIKVARPQDTVKKKAAEHLRRLDPKAYSAATSVLRGEGN